MRNETTKYAVVAPVTFLTQQTDERENYEIDILHIYSSFGIALCKSSAKSSYGDPISATRRSNIEPKGAKPEKLTKNDLQSLTAAAMTPEQHLRLAHYYEAKADRYLSESNEFQRMAEQVRENPITNNNKAVFGTVNHCEYFAQSFKQRASTMQQSAQMQEQMVKATERK